jgi:hypothetical protein
MQVYVDGLLEARGSGPTGVRGASDFLRIGALLSGGHFFTGDIDEVRLYSRALSAAEVSALARGEVVSGRLANLSVLTQLAPNETITMGTVLGGAATGGTKALVARAAGPSLAQFGVDGYLSDPNMRLNWTGSTPATVVAENNDWAGNSALSVAFAQVGAFPYASSSSKDAGVFQPALSIGGYTVEVNGPSGSSGAVIAELYDATPANAFASTTPRLINVSVLKNIAPNTNLTAGFVISGSANERVMIRAIGPTLGAAPFNIGGVMAVPKLELFNNATQAKISENDDWGGGTVLTSAFTAVGAFHLASAATKDAVLLVSLAPGQYSARVSGANDSGGTVIVEVYEVP